MANRKKKQKRAAKAHTRLHQAVNDWINSHQPTDAHIMPTNQPWHIANPQCFCVPERRGENVLTGKTIWAHRVVVH
jgi:hypothetical protein